MKTTFDKTTREELIERIKTIDESSTGQWGKMNVDQMLKHCIRWEGMVSGEVKCKRVFIGRLFGKMTLKSSTKDEKPMMRNAPSSPELVVTENGGDVPALKKKWIAMVEKNAGFPSNYFMHPFFGQMTKEQLGYHAYKHTDHHLRQFGA